VSSNVTALMPGTNHRSDCLALGEPLDQERREGNNDRGADHRADDATPVQLFRVADERTWMHVIGPEDNPAARRLRAQPVLHAM